jgi:hypothetical protein
MSKQSLINLIGKLYVDEKFRDKYFSDSEAVLKKVTGLTAKEKKFLRDNEVDIHQSIDDLGIEYKGVNKRK